MSQIASYECILALLVAQVEAAFPRQVLDPARADDGCYLDPATGFPNADHTSHSRDLAAACQVWMAPGSPLHGDPRLGERLLRGIAFLRRWQRPTGLIDLPKVDFDSPPDTAFSVQLFAPLVALARAQGADELNAALGAYVRTAAVGIVGRGFRTPNHRWVVVSALAQAIELFPDLHPVARAYVDAILAEGIDVNADGEFSERSTGIYNAVVNRSLRYAADALGRPDLLAPVRANLRFIAALLEDDATVITTISGRQDRGGRQVPVTMADSFLDLARRDGDGEFAGVFDQLVNGMLASGKSQELGWGWLLQPFLEHPELRSTTLPRQAQAEPREQWWPASALWFIKDGPLTAFAAARTGIPFAMRCGDVELRSMRVANTFFHHGSLTAPQLERIPGGVRMAGPIYRHGWDLPLNRPVPFDSCGQYYRIADEERERWWQLTVAMALDLVRDGSAFQAHLTSDSGYDRIPTQLELSFEGPGEWRTADSIIAATAGGAVRVRRGWGIFRKGDYAVRIDLESSAEDHAWWELPSLSADRDGFRVLINLQTPVDCRLRITAGRWSPAQPDVVLPLHSVPATALGGSPAPRRASAASHP